VVVRNGMGSYLITVGGIMRGGFIRYYKNATEVVVVNWVTIKTFVNAMDAFTNWQVVVVLARDHQMDEDY
jgi:hypothetical protein